MGMLQLAGVVSGFGKGLGQGLQTMQATMSQEMLNDERHKAELLRLRETFGHDRGLLKERQIFDEKQATTTHTRALERDDLAHSRALDTEDQRQDYEAGQKRITRDADRQLEGLRNQHARELEALKEDLARQAEKRKDAESQAKEGRDRKEKEKERQHMTGERIVVKSMELQEAKERGRAGATKDGHYDEKAIADVLASRIKGLRSDLAAFPTEAREKEIRAEIAYWEQEQNKLVGLQPRHAAPSRSGIDIGQLDTFKAQSPLSSPAPKTTTEPRAEPNLPRMGNLEPTLDELRVFQRDYEAAEKTGNLSEVLKAFKNKFGRQPSQADWDRLRNIRR